MSVLALARARVEAIDQRLFRGTLFRDVPWDSRTNAETVGTSWTQETPGTLPVIHLYSSKHFMSGSLFVSQQGTRQHDKLDRLLQRR